MLERKEITIDLDDAAGQREICKELRETGWTYKGEDISKRKMTIVMVFERETSAAPAATEQQGKPTSENLPSIPDEGPRVEGRLGPAVFSIRNPDTFDGDKDL